MMELILLAAIGIVVLLFSKRIKKKSESNEATPVEQKIKHRKKEHLTTINERKLYFALQKALDSKYVIHSQVSLIALVEPYEFKDKSKSWAKRMDFVITDTATKILAVIELDDSSHYTEKRVKRDAYVNDALAGHHPLIRLPTQKFYDPKEIASVLEEKAGIQHIFTKQDATHNTYEPSPRQ